MSVQSKPLFSSSCLFPTITKMLSSQLSLAFPCSPKKTYRRRKGLSVGDIKVPDDHDGCCVCLALCYVGEGVGRLYASWPGSLTNE